MLKNYLTIVLRNLRRRPGYAFINVFGLAVAMACCLLIGLYVEDELSFDRFHENVDRLFVVTGGSPGEGRSLVTPYSLASVLETSLPEVELATRVWEGRERPVRREETQLRAERLVLLAEPSFFEMFSFPAVTGDPVATLTTPDGAVITESMAGAFFGDEDPVGKTVTFHRSGDVEHTVTVRSVVKDAPLNSSFTFDLIAPLSLLGQQTLRENEWGYSIFGTYVRTVLPLATEVFSERIAESLQERLGAESEVSFSALPLTGLHLSGLRAEGLKGRPTYLYLFGTVALFILLIASVNYVNLVTAQSTQRAREVGVRKTLGAGRSQLVRQFLGESIALSMSALVLALLLLALVLPGFNALFDKQLTPAGSAFGAVLPLLIGFLLLVAMVAGAYPAFFLSRFRPVEVLRGAGGTTASGGGRMLRQALVVFQFAISAALLIGTTVVYRQLDYVQEKSLGFDGEQMVVFELPRSLSESGREVLRQRVSSHPGIVRATMATGVPGRFVMGFARPVTEVAPGARTTEESIRFRPAAVDYDFIPALNITMLAGRNFSEAFPSDLSRAYVLNRTAAERLGWSPSEAVGQRFKLGPPDVPEGEIVGVVDDFHVTSLHEAIDPVVLHLHSVGPVGSIPRVLTARLSPEHLRDGVAHIEQEVAQLAPGAAFQYFFVDEFFDRMYRAEERLARIFTAFAGLAAFIACLGLFGLAAFTAERRTKEIGIRKVMGATGANVAVLLSREFLKLVLIAFVVAAPLAYFAMRRWLEDFAYRIEIGPAVFLLAGTIALAIALVTVGHQAIKAAWADPVRALRSE